MKELHQLPQYHIAATRYCSLPAVALLLPFTINNFVQGRWQIGLCSLGVCLVLTITAITSLRGQYYEWMNSWLIVPAFLVFLAICFDQQGVIGAFWSYCALFAFYVILPERKAWIANLMLMLVVTPMAVLTLEWQITSRILATLVICSVFAIVFVRIISSQQRHLKAIASTDALTGMWNRTSLNTSLEQAIDFYKRNSTPMTLLAMDLDFFKTINDKFGHDAGDKVLVGVAKIIQDRVRNSDRIFRLGGEEFLILLHNANQQQSLQIAEEIRLEVAKANLIPDHPISISIGVSTLSEQDMHPRQDWMKRADQLLYQAKQQGRNKVIGE